MHCTQCGLELVAGSVFCPSCGKPSANGKSQVQAGLKSNVAGVLCYLGGLVSGIIFLVLEPYRRSTSIRFHAFQSIFLNATWIAFYLGTSFVYALLPRMLWSLGLMARSLLSLGFFLVWLFLMYKAYQNERFKLPLIGDLAERQAQQPESS